MSDPAATLLTWMQDYNTFVGSLERQVLPSARRLSQLDESKVLPPLSEIVDTARKIAASDLTAVLSAKLSALDETGVARPAFDLGLGFTATNPIT